MPLKLRIGAGTFGASRLSVETWLFWMTGSGVSWCRYGTFGFSFASCSDFKSDAFHRGILRSGGEMSFLYEAPTVGPLDCWFAFGACADNDPAENKPSPTNASKIAIEQRTKPTRMRGLKKADSDTDFVFMGDLRRLQPSRTDVTVKLYEKRGIVGSDLRIFVKRDDQERIHSNALNR